MPISPGTRLGSYEITNAIGAGGMGEVFRARDTRLNRDVAIKVLPAAFADDPERLARFTREAQTLASLNHPNIAAIYGLEDVGARPASPDTGARRDTSEEPGPGRPGPYSATIALIMELVDGEDLSAQIARGPIPVAEALPIARQIAEALEAAHEQGIVHRDLKPANIKVRSDGTVKVLDFGLAKAMDPAGAASSNPNLSHSPTLTHQGTMAGMIIGTAAYMSPEQAKGKAVDKRADIWAFGVVVYEMLSGKRLFRGEDVSDTLAAVLRQEIDFGALPGEAPPSVRRLVRRCLERDLRTRLRDIGEARIELMRIESGAFDPLAPSGAANASDTAARAGGSRTAWAVAAVAGMALGILALRHFSEASPEPPVMHVSLPLPARGTGFVSLSPDGRRVLASNNNLAIRDIDGDQWTYIESARGARAPFWSPDGRFVGFFADGKLKTVSVAGGPARELCGEDVVAAGGTWRSDGVILFSGRVRPMRRVPAEGGACTPVMNADPQRGAAFPESLPDGDHYLYTGQIRGDLASRGVYVGSLKDADAVPLSGKKILDDYSSVSFAPPTRPGEPGHLLFLRGSTLMAQPFDADALTLRGDPFPVASDAHASLTQPGWAGGAGLRREMIEFRLCLDG